MHPFEDYEDLEFTKAVPYIEPPEEIDSERNIRIYMEEHNENYYNARELLRERVNGGKPPDGYGSWGDYWKCR